MKYEARLSASKWTNGSGWDYQNEEIESWKVKADQLGWWKAAVENGDKSLFDYVVDNTDELYDGEISDIEWTMNLVEIDDEDDEKIIASTSVWESKLG